jgi:plastocyanin
MKRIITVALVAMIGAVGVAACGGSDHGDSQMGSDHMEENDHASTENQPVAPGARQIPVTADSLTFAPQKIDLTAGENVAIVLTSEDLAHDFYVDKVGHIVHARAGTTEEGGLSIEKAGTYRFWCTVRGHKAGGMVGTITVTA